MYSVRKPVFFLSHWWEDTMVLNVLYSCVLNVLVLNILYSLSFFFFSVYVPRFYIYKGTNQVVNIISWNNTGLSF